jgi:hypothetical protein
MKRRITFLLSVLVVLLAAIFLIGWISKTFIFGRLESPFLGALVAASGAIFAACIAYSAAIENLRTAQKAAESAEKRQADAEALRLADQRKQDIRELGQMRHLQDFLNRLLAEFGDASVPPSEHDYYSCYKKADRLGLLIPFLSSAPDNFGARAIDLMQRLIGVQRPIAQVDEDLRRTGAGAAANIARGHLSASIEAIITDGMAFREMVNNEVQRRQESHHSAALPSC